MGIREQAKYARKSISNIHRQGPKPNIFVFATARGGSTWLMDVLASQPGVKYYDEPFNIRRDNVKRTGLFPTWDVLMPDGNERERIIGFLNGLVSGEYPHMNPPPFRRNHRVLTNRVVFKIHELEHLVGEIAEACNGQVVYLLRHPIPTSQSRTVLPRLELFLASRHYNELIGSSSRRDEIHALGTRGSHLQKGVVSWCYENLIPLQDPGFKGLFVAYEELVLNPVKACDLLLKYLQLEDRSAMLRAIDEPSANIAMSSLETQVVLNEADRRSRQAYVGKWTRKVTAAEMADVTAIMQLFGLDAYTGESILPHPRFLHFADTASVLESNQAVAAG